MQESKGDTTDQISFLSKDTTFDTVTDSFRLTYKDSLMFASWNRLRKGTTPFSGELTIYFSHNVNTRTYTFKTELIAPSGKTIPLIGSENTIESRYSVYCYLTYCKTTVLTYNVLLPEGSEPGKYGLRFTGNWLGVKCTGTVCESGVPFSKSVTEDGALELIGASPSPIPTTTPSPNSLTITTDLKAYESTDSGIICYTPDFTAEAISAYSIIGTRWKVSVDYGKGLFVMDEYDWGLGLAAGGKPIREFTANGAKVSLLVESKYVNYSYAVKDQKAGNKYECSVAIRTKNGNGPFVTKSVTASYDTSSFAMTTPKPTPTKSAVKANSTSKKTRTITCLKGNLTKKVTGVNPKCPTGYSKK